MLIDTVLPVWQHGTRMSGTQSQFCLTCAVSMQERRAQKQFPVSSTVLLGKSMRVSASNSPGHAANGDADQRSERGSFCEPERWVSSLQAAPPEHAEAWTPNIAGRFRVAMRGGKTMEIFHDPRSSGRESAHSFRRRDQSRLTSAATRIGAGVRGFANASRALLILLALAVGGISGPRSWAANYPVRLDLEELGHHTALTDQYAAYGVSFQGLGTDGAQSFLSSMIAPFGSMNYAVAPPARGCRRKRGWTSTSGPWPIRWWRITTTISSRTCWWAGATGE